MYPKDNDIIKSSGDIYKLIRCGLYHFGFTKESVFLNCEGTKGIFLKGQILFVYPDKFINEIKSHLESYLLRLINTNNIILRKNFEKRFDFLVLSLKRSI